MQKGRTNKLPKPIERFNFPFCVLHCLGLVFGLKYMVKPTNLPESHMTPRRVTAR